MPSRKRDLLADAYEEIRTLKNQAAATNVDREAWTMPLRAEIQALRADNDRLLGESMALARLRSDLANRLSDVELHALAAVVYTEAGEQTAARSRLVRELTLRGVLTGKAA